MIHFKTAFLFEHKTDCIKSQTKVHIAFIFQKIKKQILNVKVSNRKKFIRVKNFIKKSFKTLKIYIYNLVS